MKQPQNIVVVTAVYPPEPVVSAQNARDLAVYLATFGDQLSVICPSPSRPMGAEYSGLRATRKPLVRDEDGVAVVRLPSFTAPQSRLIPRMRESWSFGSHICRYLGAQPTQPDVVYMNAWPLFSQALVARYCKARNIPLVMQVMDVYPESLVEKLPRPLRAPIQRPLLSMDRWIARQADRVVLISNSMREHYVRSRRLAPGKAALVHTWIDDAIFRIMPDRVQSAAHYGVPSDLLTFVFLGNIGPVAGVELLIEAFHDAALPTAQLLIIGDGSSKASCVRLAKQLGASDRVRFISDPDASNTPRLLSLGDVCVLPMRKGSGASSLPSKMMAYMLAGKPIIATVDAASDTARCVIESDSGWVGEPENPQWLAGKMREVAAMGRETGAGGERRGEVRGKGQGKLEELGQKGRAYAMLHFSKAKGVQQLGAIIERQARNGS